MTEHREPSAAEPSAARPPRVAAAAALTGLEGLAVAVVGLVMLAEAALGQADGVRQAVTGGATVLLLAAVPLAAGHGLWRLRRWSRGPAVVTQILALPVSWNLLTHGEGLTRPGGAVLATAALAVLGCLLSPAAARALGAPASRA